MIFAYTPEPTLAFGAPQDVEPLVVAGRAHSRAVGLDWDGNGTQDVAWSYLFGDQWIFHFWESGTSGNLTYKDYTSTTIWSAARPMFAPLDLEGDGDTDLCLVDLVNGDTTNAWKMKCARSNGDGTFTFVSRLNFDVHYTPSAGDDNNGVPPDGARVLTGDIDGDADTDLCLDHLNWSSQSIVHALHCVLNDGAGTFTSIPGLFDNMVTSAAARVYIGWDKHAFHLLDVTGDHIDDLCFEGPSAGLTAQWETICWRGRGDGLFDDPVAQYFTGWTSGSFAESTSTTGDFNGDGLKELCRSVGWSDGLWIMCVLADGYGEPNEPGLGFFDPTPVSRKVYSSYAADYEDGLTPGDFNGDGNTDLCAVLTGAHDGLKWASLCALSDGRGGFFNAGRTVHHSGGVWTPNSGKLAGDFNGDGLTDLFAAEDLLFSPLGSGVYTLELHSALKQGGQPVLFYREENGIGGATLVGYRPSSRWVNKNNPPIMHTVDAVTSFDGLRGFTTAYKYSGGEMHRAERRFLGFEYMWEHPPIIAGETVGPRNVTRFSQTLTALGKPIETWRQRWDGAAYQNMTWAVFTYHHSPAGALPRTSLLMGRADYMYDDAGNYLATHKAYTYDNRYRQASYWPYFYLWGTGREQVAGYGVPRTVSDFGNSSLSGDEETTNFSYVPNHADFLVKPYRILRMSESDVISDTYLYYDLAIDTPLNPLPNPKQAPVDGMLTHKLDWLNTTAAYVPTQRFAYDSFGNVIRSRDARGYDTTFTIDPTYNLLVVATANALGHTTSAPLASWVLRCNAPGASTDANGVTTQTYFDSLCRPSSIDSYAGSTWVAHEAYDYHEALRGEPAAQYVEKLSPSADGLSDQFARSYYDGLGRVYRTETKGPSATQAIRNNVVLDDRGNVWKSYAPYYANAAAPMPTEHRYDALGRKTRTILPDGSVETQSYGLDTLASDPVGVVRWLRVDRTDGGSHLSAQRINARGRVDESGEDVGTTLAWTEYDYTPAGVLRLAKDPDGNLAEYTYDTLGRMTRHNDPDRGIWDFEYDNAGNLTRTWQAVVLPSGQRQSVTVDYDALSRPTRKTVLDALGKRITEYLYDQARPGFYNIGKLTTARDNCDLGTCSHSPFVTGAALSAECNAMVSRVCAGKSTCCKGGSWDASCVAAAQAWCGECAHDSQAERSTIYLDYNGAGRLAWRHQSVDEKSFLFRRTYDLGGRLKTLVVPGETVGPITYDGAGRVQAIPGFVESATYTASGQLLTQFNTNSTATIYSYDPARLWLTGINTRANTTSLQALDLSSRDSEGNLRSLGSAGPHEGWSAFGYNDQHFLTAATNASSSLNSQDFKYNPIGNVTYNSRAGTTPACAAPGDNYCYDPLMPHAVSRAGLTSYTYDPNGNMVTSASGAQLRTYDGENRLVQTSDSTWLLRFAYDALGARSKKTENGSRTLYVGDDYEVAPSGDTTFYISLGGRLVAKSVRYANGATEKFWIHTDHLGSVNVITDAVGELRLRLAYRPYGEVLAMWGAHPESRTYTAQRQDANGLYYLHARYYDPKLARFISADSIIPSAVLVGLNRYAYGNNNPLLFVDPTGHWSWSRIQWAGLFQALGGAVEVYIGVSVAVGACAATVGAGCAAGVAMILLGTDTFMAGIGTMQSGQPTMPLLQQGATWVGDDVFGMDPESAAGFGFAFNFATHAVVGGVAGGYAAGTGSGAGGVSVAGDGTLAIVAMELGVTEAQLLGTVGGVVGASGLPAAMMGRISDKAASSDKPSWLQERPRPGEDGKTFAKRVCDERYGEGNYPTGPGSEYSKIQKWVDRHR